MVKSRKVKNIFQSTPSVWRATHCGAKMDGKEVISIHALRGEGATAKIYKYAMLCLYIVHIKLYIFATAVLFT